MVMHVLPAITQRLFKTIQGGELRYVLFRGAAGVGVVRLLSIPLTLASSVLLARGLGPEGFGQYAFIMAVVTILSLPLDQGMRQLITREVAGYHHDRQYALLLGFLRRADEWVLLGAVLIAFTLGTVAAYQASWCLEDHWTLILVSLSIPPFLGLNALRGSTLRGLGYVVQAQLPELLVRPSSYLLIAAVLLNFSQLNPLTALASQAIAALFSFGIGAILLKRQWPSELQDFVIEYQSGQWARAWAAFTLLMAAGMLNNQLGILLLGWLGTNEQVAALRVADRGAQLVSISLAVVNLVIAPQITHAYLHGNRRRLQKLSTHSARAALAIALPIALPLIFLGGPVIKLIFGEVYVKLAVAPLAVLATAQLVNVMFGSVGMFLMMSGNERDTLLGQVVALALNILAALLLIPTFGAYGAACAAAIGLVTCNVIFAAKIVQRLNLRPTAF